MNQRTATPDLSVVIPCYNEEHDLPLSMPPLFAALRGLGISYELVLVDNGSRDRTAEIIDGFTATEPVVHVTVVDNQGYGLGIISGLSAARGRFVCQMWADAQVEAGDVARTITAAIASAPGTIVKVRRITREDGLVRKLISLTWNGLFRLFFGGGGLDVNGCPKVYHRDDLARLALERKDSFLDAEAMIKARLLGFDVVEIPVRFHARAGGSSKIKILGYAASFVRNIIVFRFGRPLAAWKRARAAEAEQLARQENGAPASPAKRKVAS